MKANKSLSNNRAVKLLIFVILIFTLLIQSAIIASPINQVEDTIAISNSEFNDINTVFPINYSVTYKGYGSYIIKFKLLDLFTIKTIEANVSEDEYLYIGGEPIGITLKTEGVIITGKSDVITSEGLKSPTKNADIANGDLLLKLNDVNINTLEDIRNFLSKNNDSIIYATMRRRDKIFIIPLEPAVDTLTGDKRLGLFIKEEISGVGTLTYIDGSNNHFGALGHNVSENLTGGNPSKIKGNIYKCSIIDVKKGERGQAGELRGYFSRTENRGEIIKNNSYGIYGNADKSFIEGKQKVVMGSRFSAKVGRAEIWTTIEGDTPRKYEIEIIKLNYQKTEGEKGMVIRVTDKELLEKTGGIVQGMSGSPIVQDGKIIGAVTHVFLNDPTKGYGIYIDWMKSN